MRNEHYYFVETWAAEVEVYCFPATVLERAQARAIDSLVVHHFQQDLVGPFVPHFLTGFGRGHGRCMEEGARGMQHW